MKRISHWFAPVLALAMVCVACEKSEKGEARSATTAAAEATVAETNTAKPRAQATVPAEGAEPEVISVQKITRKMRWDRNPPESIAPPESSVVLSFVNFPGFYEVLLGEDLAACLEKNADRPFDVTFNRLIYREGDEVLRVVDLEPCPEMEFEGEPTEKQRVAKRRESEKGEAKLFEGAKLEKKGQIGWVGTGYFRVAEGEAEGDADDPLADGWNTFCGGATGVTCDEY